MLYSLLSISLLGSFAFGAALDARAAACKADNCARAVSGTNPAIRPTQHVSDCSSFMRTTITPAATTTTTTFTITTTSLTISTSTSVVSTVTDIVSTQTLVISTETDIGSTATVIVSTETDTASTETDTVSTETDTATVTPPIQRRVVQVNPTPSVPTYAFACSGAVRYSSACSCFGIPLATVTAARPTSTATQTVTATQSVIATSSVTVTTTITALTSVTTSTFITTTVYATSTLDVTATTDVTSTTTSTVTATPYVSCNYGASCANDYFGEAGCPAQSNGDESVCVSSADGVGICVDVYSSCNTECTTDADCSSSEFCSVNTCCGSVCLSYFGLNYKMKERSLNGTRLMPESWYDSHSS